MANVGKNIRLLRTQKNMTQDELAERLFVSRQTISNYETGRSQPDIDTLLRIAEALDVEAQHLLYGSPDTQAQLIQKKRAIASSFALAGFAVIYHLLVQLYETLRPTYFLAGLAYPLALLLRPSLFLLAGWTLMQLLGILTKARPLQTRWARFAFWGMIAALVSYYILILPHCGWAVWSSWEVWQLRLSGQEYSYSSSFSITPWWNAAVHWILSHIKSLIWVFPVTGIALWLTGSFSKAAYDPSDTEPPTNPTQ